MTRKAVINPKTNIVENVIEARDGFTMEGFTLVDVEPSVGIGDVRDGKVFTRPPEPKPEPQNEIQPLVGEVLESLKTDPGFLEEIARRVAAMKV